MSIPPGPQRGRFIVFEGGDGSGKSTQAKLLAEALGAHLTREPGGTPISEQIRDLVLDPKNAELHERTEALLMAASRAQHVAEFIEPRLRAGESVITDRFIASSLAYQGVGRQLGVDAVARVNEMALGGLVPDVTVLLDVPAVAATSRIDRDLDRIEQASLSVVVADCYRTFAQQDPAGWLVIEASGSIEEIHDRIYAAIRERFDQ